MLRAELTSIHTEAIDAPPWLCSDQISVQTVQRHNFAIYFETSENAKSDSYLPGNNTIILLAVAMQYENDNTTFHWSSAVSDSLALL